MANVANPPCPQGAFQNATAPPPLNSLLFAIEDPDAAPRLPTALSAINLDRETVIAPLPYRRWPYHLPAWNGMDQYWWTLLARASYANVDTYIRALALWSQPVVRLDFRNPSIPAVQGRTFIEFADCFVIVYPGTNSEQELSSYLMTHALDEFTTDEANDWSVNSTWWDRAIDPYREFLAFRQDLEKPVVCIGHSSGGAYAALTAAWTALNHPNSLATVITYGAPRWSTESFRLVFRKQRNFQAIESTTPGDPIPQIPPPYAGIRRLLSNVEYSPFPPFSHFGLLMTFQPLGELNPTGETENTNTLLATATAIINGQVDLGAHATSSYNLRANAVAANQFALGTNQALLANLQALEAEMNAAGV